MEIHTGTIYPAPPFDFAQSLAFLSEFTPMRGEHTVTLQSLTKAAQVDGQTVVFTVISAGDGDAPRLDYTLHSAQPLGEAAHARLEQRIAFFLSTADDLRPFYALGADDPLFAPIIAKLHGYHQVTFLTPFENACWAVLTQRNQVANARNMKRAIMDHFGGGILHDGVRYDPFPDAAQLADAGTAALTALTRHAQKAQYLSAIAAAFAAADETWLRSAPYSEVEAWLRAINGIGAWSAAFVLLRGLGRMERIPPGEAALARAAANVYNGGVPLRPAEVPRIAARYGAYQGYWAHYLRVGGG